MTLRNTDTPIAFHLSLNTGNISASVAFFEQLFGMSASKQRADYAKFELDNPPITLSLEPLDPAGNGRLNHVGFKLKSTEALVELQKQLEMQGVRTQREDGVECCYAKQSKFWLHDPDQTLWELYVLEGDLEHRGAGQSAEAIGAATSSSQPERIVCSTPRPQSENRWSHRLGHPLSIAEEIAAELLEEISLQGSFNGTHTRDERANFLHSLAACLEPGGVLRLHCLTADSPITEPLDLPGPASVVRQAPELAELIDDLQTAGFTAIELTKYAGKPCFSVGSVGLRETRLQAKKAAVAGEEQVRVVYRGPFAALRLSREIELASGRPVSIPRSLLETIPEETRRESLTLLEPITQPISCTS